MRELKFRAWDKVEKKYIYDFLNYCFMNFKISYNPWNDDRYIKEQYTGLKDKNGVEIYEGDIVVYEWLNHPFNAVVRWDEKRCKFYYSDKNFNNADHLIVIGNVNENHELLEKVK